MSGFLLPSFILSDPSVSAIHALYGSCRKLHGPDPDMMRAVTHVLEKAPDGRPTYLFLGGDQIYADDVHKSLLPAINYLGNQLIGRKEEIPELPPLALRPISSRGSLLDKLVKVGGKSIFTSGDKDFHLLTFGEYASTYFLAWNSEMWSALPITKSPKISLSEAFRGSRQARKALANIITYMIFDDHEITDDWFLNEEWRKNAESNQSSERIITNGLAAYWAFQGWGNNPSDFSESFRELMSDFTLKGRRADQAQGALLDAGRWSYIAPTSPPTLFLDTRTGRTKSPKLVDGRPAKGSLHKTLVDQHGSPSFIVEEKLMKRDEQKIALVNNIGELKMTDRVVSHRLWKANKNDFKADDFLIWSANAWPAPRVWP